MKKHYSPLCFFLFGILFYEIIFPILSSVGEVIQGGLQLILGKQAVQMTKYKKTIEKYKAEQNKEPEHTFCMGFHVPSNSDDEEDEDDE